MAQDRFINITVDPNAGSKEITNHNHGKGMGSAAAGDLTVSYDSTKFTTLTLFRSAVLAAVALAAGMMKQ